MRNHRDFVAYLLLIPFIAFSLFGGKIMGYETWAVMPQVVYTLYLFWRIRLR